MEFKVSFIGTGNMGGALLHAACRTIDPKRIHITDHQLQKAREQAEALGCCCETSNTDAVLQGNYIFLCVKPQVMGSVLEEIAPVLKSCLEQGERKVIVSIAAGLQTAYLKEKLASCGSRLQVIRVMPNTPAAIGKGMLAVAAGPEVDEENIQAVMEILADAGRVERLSENLMDQFTVVSGCSPAFVYMFIEALADGGVMTGLPRSQALTYAAQTVLGAAAMVLETGRHPGELKDTVCSPAGSTIAGVAKLEEKGFRSAAIQAVKAGYDKNVELGKVK